MAITIVLLYVHSESGLVILKTQAIRSINPATMRVTLGSHRTVGLQNAGL